MVYLGIYTKTKNNTPDKLIKEGVLAGMYENGVLLTDCTFYEIDKYCFIRYDKKENKYYLLTGFNMKIHKDDIKYCYECKVFRIKDEETATHYNSPNSMHAEGEACRYCRNLVTDALEYIKELEDDIKFLENMIKQKKR